MDNRIKDLVDKALVASKKAYAPYSKFHVGSALITENGNVFTGCNVENASYGLTICAERNAIFAAVAAEGPGMRIKAISAIVDSESPGAPCGACRQVIAEFSTANTEVIYYSKEGVVVKKMDAVLPDTFELKFP